MVIGKNGSETHAYDRTVYEVLHTYVTGKYNDVGKVGKVSILDSYMVHVYEINGRPAIISGYS